MSKRMILINTVLLATTALLVSKTYNAMNHPVPPQKGDSPAKQKAAASAVMVPQPETRDPSPPTTYKAISEKNIFSPDRKEFPVIQMPETVKKAASRPNVTLYGIAFGESFRSAIINNPTRRSEKGEREVMSVKVGDRVGEYTVKEILDDRITLESHEDSFSVLLYDPARRKKRAAVTSPAQPSPLPVPTAPQPIQKPPGITAPASVPPRSTVITPQPPRPSGTFQGRGVAPARQLPATPRGIQGRESEQDDDED